MHSTHLDASIEYHFRDKDSDSLLKKRLERNNFSKDLDAYCIHIVKASRRDYGKNDILKNYVGLGI